MLITLLGGGSNPHVERPVPPHSQLSATHSEEMIPFLGRISE